MVRTAIAVMPHLREVRVAGIALNTEGTPVFTIWRNGDIQGNGPECLQPNAADTKLLRDMLAALPKNVKPTCISGLVLTLGVMPWQLPQTLQAIRKVLKQNKVEQVSWFSNQPNLRISL